MWTKKRAITTTTARSSPTTPSCSMATWTTLQRVKLPLSLSQHPHPAHALVRTLTPALQKLDPASSDAPRCAARWTRGFAAYEDYRAAVRKKGEEALKWARANGRRVMILAGRPYHVDPEISATASTSLAASLGFAVVTRGQRVRPCAGAEVRMSSTSGRIMRGSTARHNMPCGA